MYFTIIHIKLDFILRDFFCFILFGPSYGKRLSGELKSTLSKHKGPIFCLKWNKNGDYILTGSCDRTAIVWDVRNEELKQLFEFHSGALL